MLLPTILPLIALQSISAAAPTSTSSAKSGASTTAPKTVNLQSSFLYELDQASITAPTVKTKSGVNINASVYIVDLENTSKADIQRYKDAGKTVVCYFSAGTWENFRSDKKQLLPQCYCGPNVKTDADGNCIGDGANDDLLADWGEWWLDLHSDTCKTNVKSVQAKRIQAAKDKGCDGIDPDNVDSYLPQQNQAHGNTQKDEYGYLMWLADQAHSRGMILDLKNSPDMIQSTYGPAVVKSFDFSVIEECARYNECSSYDPFLKAGKPQIEIEYSNYLKKCPSDQPKGRTVAVYKGTVLDSRDITVYCPPPK